MDIKEIRRQNLKKLRRMFGTNVEFANRLEMDPSQVWQYLADPEAKSSRPIGDRVARRVETSLNLRYGSMDTPINANQINDEAGSYSGEDFFSVAEPSEDPRIAGKVPLISKVKAGEADFSANYLEPGDADEWLYCNTRHSQYTYALVVDGESMESPYGKTYPDGSIIFVDPELRGGVVNGDPIVAKISGVDAVTFKILAEEDGRKFLKPLNRQHPINTREFRVLGKVIEKLEREK